MKSKNKTYIILLTVIIICFGFFFSSKIWMPDDRIMQKGVYNELFMTGDWSLHVGNAKYDKTNSIITAMLYQKSTSDNPSPYNISVFLGNPDNQKSLSYRIIKQKNDPDYVTIKIDNVPQDYYYVTVRFTTKESADDESSSAASSDEFDDESSSQTSDTTTVNDVKIDYRTAQCTSSTNSTTSDTRTG